MTLQLSKNIHCQDFQKLRSVGRRGEFGAQIILGFVVGYVLKCQTNF